MIHVRILQLVAATGVIVAAAAASDAANIVTIARSFPDGGSYELKGSGVPEEIRFKGERILSESESTYCSGFTFAVVMKAAEERGLLRSKSVAQVRAFQKQWYGATKESGETQCAFAVEQLGIGKGVKPQRAKPGDFLQLWRTSTSGHSAVFLGWVKEGGRPIGVKYRSSQPATQGIGDHVEYFAGVPGKRGRVDPERMYFARLNTSRR